jgi:hypothetical protein
MYRIRAKNNTGLGKLWLGHLMERDYFGNLGVDGRILLKLILKE